MRFPLKLKVLLRTANFFWVDFCSTTGIRGFSFITKSIFRVESYFWLILVVICAYLTLIDVRNTIQLYMMEPTITKVIVMNNNSISLGSPTVCIDLNIENMKFGPVDLLQPETVRKFIRKFSQKHQSLSGYLNDTFNWLKTFEPTDLELVRKVPQFSYKSFNNSELDLVENELMPALSLAVSVVSGIVRVEQLVRLDYSLVQLNWGIRKKSVDPSYETDYIDGKTSEAVGVFYNFILSKGESFDQILHLSGALMCEMMQLQVV